jgi:hypothetical protein
MLKKNSLGLFLALLTIIQLACNASAGPATPNTIATLDGLYTAAAQTGTAAAVQGDATVTPGLPLPTASPIVQPPTSTPFSIPTTGPVARCDAVDFVKDISISDGATQARGATFVKTWRLLNTGTCSWTPAYALVFVSGDSMGGPAVVALTGNVNPGQTIDLSVTLIAPGKDGHYRGYWELRNASNTLFGLGQTGDTAFWVDINVKGPAYAAYDFVSNYCAASWENNNNPLPCPGVEGTDSGFVLQLNSPKLENGVKTDDPTLLTVPKNSNNGLIMGTYPAFSVQAGDRFRALLSCKFNSNRCDVTFRLDYKIGGQTRTLAAWHEVYEGQYSTVDLDLSALDGQTVKFILVVTANGSARDDEVLWVAPRIIRNGVPPATLTPTVTPTSTSTSTPTATPTP